MPSDKSRQNGKQSHPSHLIIYFFFVLLIIVAVIIIFSKRLSPESSPVSQPSPQISNEISSSSPQTNTQPATPGSPSASQSAAPSETPSPSSLSPGPEYDFSAPVPECKPVDNSYFDDSIFIGDSREEGFVMYSGLDNIRGFTNVGANVSNVFDKPSVYIGDEKLPIMDAVAQTEFKKVYTMFGVNELGWADIDSWKDEYARIIDRIREINPNATVYIQAIFPVSAEKDASGDIYTNEHVNMFNERLLALAQEKQVYLVNTYEALSDENGCLPEDASYDGVHLTPEYTDVWLEYLKTHVVEEK